MNLESPESMWCSSPPMTASGWVHSTGRYTHIRKQSSYTLLPLYIGRVYPQSKRAELAVTSGCCYRNKNLKLYSRCNSRLQIWLSICINSHFTLLECWNNRVLNHLMVRNKSCLIIRQLLRNPQGLPIINMHLGARQTSSLAKQHCLLL